MFMYAVKKPAAAAAAAAAALGENGTAVFCEGPGLLFASARGETPDAGITTAIFNDVEKGDIHDGDRRPLGQGVGNRERHARRARPQGGTGRRRVSVPHPAEAVLG